MSREKGYQLLKRNLTDNIKEQQAKLGYRKECIYLYYPLSSLNHFFKTNDEPEDMMKRLSDLPEDITATLGHVEVSRNNERFCFKIPEYGGQYVHEHIADDEFINALIFTLSQPGCTMETIIRLFQTYTADIEVQEMDHGEFDYRIRFLNREEDSYYYCFHDEGCQIVYHRFTPEDYRDFNFSGN